MKIGIFGGTFDPIHFGHLNMAVDARRQLSLDRVLFVVAGDPWQKEVQTDAKTRGWLTELATVHLPWIDVSDVEIKRSGPTYTIDTVRELSRPDDELFLIVGSDQANNLESWKDHDVIKDYATIYVQPRWLNLSSTVIRERVRNGQSIDYLVPSLVAAAIDQLQLYR